MTHIPSDPGGKINLQFYGEVMNPTDSKKAPPYDPNDPRQIGDIADVGELIKQKTEEEESNNQTND